MTLFVIYSLGRGGAERVVVHIANYWVKQGREIGILTFDQSTPQYDLDPRIRLIQANIAVPSTHLLIAIFNNLKRLWILRGWFKTLRPSTVISFTEDVNVVVSLASIGRHFRLILSDRIHPSWAGNRPMWQFFKKISYRLVDVLVVQTKAVKAAYTGFTTPIVVINNPLNIVPQKSINYKNKAIIAIGRLDAQKNFPLLIQSFSQLKQTDWTLHIFGEGKEKDALNALILSKHLEKRVILRGGTEDVFGEMAQASVFVLSSLAEGYPNVLIEAMSAGLAVVSTDCPCGPAEIVVHEKNGLLVPNNDEKALSTALQRLVNDANLREKLGQEAVKITNDLSIEKIVTQWERLL